MDNFDHPIFKALRKLELAGNHNEPNTGRYFALKCFRDPGRGDIYLETMEGDRVCIEAQGDVTFKEWDSEEWAKL